MRYLLSIFLQAGDSIVSGDYIMKQGPTIALLCVAIWYFYKRQQKLEADNQAMKDKHEQYLQEDRITLTRLVENNNQVMGEIKQFIERTEERLSKLNV
jgi:hypothetical protein